MSSALTVLSNAREISLVWIVRSLVTISRIKGLDWPGWAPAILINFEAKRRNIVRGAIHGVRVTVDHLQGQGVHHRSFAWPFHLRRNQNHQPSRMVKDGQGGGRLDQIRWQAMAKAPKLKTQRIEAQPLPPQKDNSRAACCLTSCNTTAP